MKKLFLLLACSSICFSCLKQDDLLEIKPTLQRAEMPQLITRSLSVDDGEDAEVVLGRKLNNPYTVSNMQVAYNQIKSQLRTTYAVTTLAPTHRYVKFMPKDSIELGHIEADTTLDLFVYPLDYEILTEGTVYQDPELPEGQPEYRYAAVPVNYEYPYGVAYEVLDDLFLPKEGTPTRGDGPEVMPAGDLEKLVDIAETLANNPSEPMAVSNERYQPRGQIIVWDDVLQDYIPLEGVKVRARRWFTVHRGYTDDTGFFRCSGTFKRPCNYSIVWESMFWDIRNGTFGQAFYNGPKKAGPWTLTITGNKSLRYATIHRAAWVYWFGSKENIEFLDRPFHVRKVKICYKHKQGNNKSGDYWLSLGAGIFPDIRIYGKGKGGWYLTSEIFGTTIHELAHAAHCKAIGRIEYYFDTDAVIRESWATYVEKTLTYRHYRLHNYHEFDKDVSFRQGTRILHFTLPNQWNKQGWMGYTSSELYTPLFIDLVDVSNQRQWAQLSKYPDYLSYPNDVMSGFKSAELQELLYKIRNVTDLQKELKAFKDKYNHKYTDEMVDALFELWNK